MENNNTKLNKIKDILLKQLERLDNQEIMEKEGKYEIKRSGAITSNAITFVKTTDLELKILNTANKYNIKAEQLQDYLGLKD